jgi:hypothetical protein
MLPVFPVLLPVDMLGAVLGMVVGEVPGALWQAAIAANTAKADTD